MANKLDRPVDQILIAEVVELLKNYDKSDPYITNTAKRIILKVEEYRGKL